MSGVLLPAPHPCLLRRAPLLGLVVLAAAPVLYIAAQVVRTSRNIAFWDEYDSVLGFILRLDAGTGLIDFFSRLFHLDSEHRTVTSRLLFATSYWLTGAVNFHVISAIGNLTLIGLCLLLVACARDTVRRVQLAVLLAFGLFHLQHYEPFLWSGASIDHFQILLLAGGALAALAQGSRAGCAAGGLLAVLATFTLAHGCVVWPIGAILLWRLRRWRELAAWAALAAAALAIFLHGFEINAAHRFTDFSLGGIGRLARFWLALLGGCMTFGDRAAAPVFGGALLLALGWLHARGVWQREPIAAAVALFAIGSLGLIAFGRLGVAGEHIQSRYLVLSSLAWALTGYLMLERLSDPVRPLRLLAWCLPALVVYNFAANIRAAPRAETFLLSRDYPAARFKQFGDDSHGGPFRLHPMRGTARKMLAETAARGIYHLPRFCEPALFPEARPNARLVTYVTDLTASEHAVGFEGWAMIPQRKSRAGSIHVILRSARNEYVFTTLSVARPDVAKALKEPLWRYCGDNFVLPRHRLPAEDFQIGLLIAEGDHAEYAMTDQWLRLAGNPATAPLASRL